MANAKPTWLQDKNNENILVPHTLVEMVQDVNGNSLNDLLNNNKISYEVDGERLKIKGGTDASDRHVYSESEHIVGRWIDGKPLYEKTIQLEGSTPQSLPENCDTIFVTGGFHYNTGGYIYPISANTQHGYMLIQINKSDNNIYVQNVAFALEYSIVTIQYTKKD